MFKTSKGATADRIPGETNDCGVIGLANATGLPYKEIHERLRLKGRRFRRGTKIHMIEAVLADFKREGIVSEYKSVFNDFAGSYAMVQKPTVASFLRNLPRAGHFFICSSRHAFALVNGTLYNNMERTQMRARMRVALQVTMTKQVAPVHVPATSKAIQPTTDRPRFDAEEYQRRAMAAKVLAKIV